jgi:glycerol dehydrogenase-like iron-containing ADH family enzyme
MAINPNISLAVETPQFDPAHAIGSALTIRSMQQQQLLHGEQLKSAQIANQEHQKAQQDDTLNTQTWQQANGDPVKHVEMFAKSGARPQAVQALQKHYADLRKE